MQAIEQILSLILDFLLGLLTLTINFFIAALTLVLNFAQSLVGFVS